MSKMKKEENRADLACVSPRLLRHFHGDEASQEHRPYIAMVRSSLLSIALLNVAAAFECDCSWRTKFSCPLDHDALDLDGDGHIDRHEAIDLNKAPASPPSLSG